MTSAPVPVPWPPRTPRRGTRRQRVVAALLAAALAAAVLLGGDPVQLLPLTDWQRGTSSTVLLLVLVAAVALAELRAGTGVGVAVAVAVGAVVGAVGAVARGGTSAAALLPEVVVAGLWLGALGVGVSGTVYALRCVRRGAGRWAALVAVLGAVAWFAWLDWGQVGEEPPGGGWLLLGATATLLVAAVVGELRVGTWYGALLAGVPFAAVSFGPVTSSDAQGGVGWAALVVAVAVLVLLVVGGVAAGRRLARRPPRVGP